jgi:serine/threonine protein phosphatase 1
MPLESFLDMGGAATLASYGSVQDLSLVPDEHFGFLEQCRSFYETATHLFIHANYQPSLPLDQQSGLMLRWVSLRDFTPGPHASRKTVIAGHTSQKNGEILDLGYLKCIDTCCYGGGWLTAMDAETLDVWQADRRGVLRNR